MSASIPAHEDEKTDVYLRSWFYKFVGIFVSVSFVYLAVRRVDVAESMKALRDVQPILLGCAALVYLTSFPVRALRWQFILRSQKVLSWGEIMVPIFVGYMANIVIPARVGEIYRAHFLGRRVRMSRSGVAASIVVERTLDGLMLVGVILLVFILFPQAHFLGSAAIAVGLAFLLLAGIIFCGLTVDKAYQGIEWGLRLLPPTPRGHVSCRLDIFLQGIRGISTVRKFLTAILLSVLIWMIDTCAIALVVVSFGISLPLSGFVLVSALTALSITLPSGPGYIGPFQYAFVLSLGFFAVSQGTALTVSIAAQLALLGSVTLIGLVLLLREQLLTRGLRGPRSGSGRTVP